MSKNHIAILAACLAALGLILPITILGNSTTDPHIPTGSLTAYPTQVQTGTNPQLIWSIGYPENVGNVVTITPPGTITPNRDLCMDVRVIGASVKRVWTNQYGQVIDWEWVNTECQMKYGGNSYQRIFYGKQTDVNPNMVVHSQVVTPDNSINFGGRYVQSNGSWSTWYSSTNSANNVIALKNGDNPPDVQALYGQQTVEDFLRPYIDSNGNIKIGPKDVIYLIELTHTNQSHGGFDLQDLVLLVTFKNTHGNGTCSNNGHGNNVDGVDSSNPGGGSGGPNGGDDPSGSIDDEIR